MEDLSKDVWRNHRLAAHWRTLEAEGNGLEAVWLLLEGKDLSDAGGVLWLCATLLYLGDECRQSQPVLAGLYYYRTLELLLQQHLASHGYDSDAPRLSDPAKDIMQRSLARWRNASPGQIDVPGGLGLLDDMALLRFLGDPLVQGFTDDEIQGYQGILQAWNKALLIHGLEVSRRGDLEKLRELAHGLYGNVREGVGLQPSVAPVPLP